MESLFLPRNTVTWDPVFCSVFSRANLQMENWTLKMLNFKTVTFLTLLSAQKIQTIHLFDIRKMFTTASIVKVSIGNKFILMNSPGQRHCPSFSC